MPNTKQIAEIAKDKGVSFEYANRVVTEVKTALTPLSKRVNIVEDGQQREITVTEQLTRFTSRIDSQED